jgi:hypothetical protein
MRTCTTHHHACDRRERKFAALEAENAKLREAGDALSAIINTSVGAPVSRWPDDNQMDAAIAAWNAAKKTA